jgi:hypothetical protein
MPASDKELRQEQAVAKENYSALALTAATTRSSAKPKARLTAD